MYLLGDFIRVAGSNRPKWLLRNVVRKTTQAACLTPNILVRIEKPPNTKVCGVCIMTLTCKSRQLYQKVPTTSAEADCELSATLSLLF